MEILTMRDGDAVEIDVADIFGPDRDLPCGCKVINGAICLVSQDVTLTGSYVRPGRVIFARDPDHA